ncbi:MAG TPA: plastocyanin/azurin family copper-binding protein [Candidatus Eisenbacteria bacterium]|nr:plastocyanin/azurin family copper-binding protein [Candidatus Eisenbacteria bacterium]
MFRFRIGRPSHGGWIALMVVALLLAADALLFAQGAGHTGGSSMSMSDAEMGHWVKEFYKTHPVVGRLAPQGAPVDTFIASGTSFDTDGNTGTQIDTMRIHTHDTVWWHAASGSHTVTNGTGSLDPAAGKTFDAAIVSPSNPNFAFEFDTPGQYNFFCRPHEGFNMKGVVIVTDAPPAAPADTFTASGLQFDTDQKPGTQVDTAFVNVGQTILWRDLAGIHTVTNGTGSLDPAAGTLFDADLTLDSDTFEFQFTQAGTFPFFCRVHESSNMRGVVVVTDPVAVGPLPGRQVIGFASEPEPNPTRHGVSFRLAMPTAGRAVVRVYDARGQLIAVPFDRELGAGVWSVTWDGSTAGGGRAKSGVYFLRLVVPGDQASRSVVLTH